MDLFQMKNNVFTFSPQALALKPFKELWTRDKTKSKEKATAELAYLWYMTEIKSPFFYIVDPELRSKEIAKMVDKLGESWKPDKKVQDALEFYKNSKRTLSGEMLDNSIALLVKLNKFMANIDPSETYKDKNGIIHFKYDFKKVMDINKQIPEAILKLEETKKRVLKDEEQASGMRGVLEKNILEDGA